MAKINTKSSYKLSRKEKEILGKRMNDERRKDGKIDRGPTWVGIRPSIHLSGKDEAKNTACDKMVVKKIIEEEFEDNMPFNQIEDIDVGDVGNIEGITINGKPLSEYYNLETCLDSLPDNNTSNIDDFDELLETKQIEASKSIQHKSSKIHPQERDS